MPRTRQVADAELLDRLMDVFRRYGYEGASLTLLSEAAGLGRASLYHRFPGGKPEMAEAVLDHAGEILAAYALKPLEGSGDPTERLEAMAEALADFYDGGRRSCLLDTLSFGGEKDPVATRVEDLVERWVEAIARVARESGVHPDEARERAEDGIAAIQGGLVLSRATGDPSAFRRALASLPRIVMAGGRD